MIKVLIADDEEKVCQLIKNLVPWQEIGLELIGFAHNGINALEMIEKENPDIVITDIRMPGYDGIELIKRAKETNPNINFIIVSGYRHFDYAHNAIKYGVGDYLLKPLKKNELLNTLNKIVEKDNQKNKQIGESEALKKRIKNDMEKLRMGFMVDLLFNNANEIKNIDLEKANNEYHFSFVKDHFQAIVVKTDLYYKENNDSIYNLLIDRTIPIIEKHLKPICHDISIYCSSTGIYCVLNYDSEVKKNIRKYYKNVLDEINTMSDLFLGLKVSIGAGYTVNDLNGVSSSLLGAIDAVANRIVVGTGKIIEIGSIKPSSLKVDQFIDSESQRMFLSYIEILDKKGIENYLSALKSNVLHHENLDSKLVYQICNTTLDLFLFALKRHSFSLEKEQEFLQNHEKMLNWCSSLLDVFQLLSSEILEQVEIMITDKKAMDTKPIRQAKQYMQQHYCLPLTLEEVSSMVGFNPAYFSYLFKKETGMNFLEYLVEIRISKAKQLLIETTQSIAMISEAVGYNDLKHFSKLFTKTTGLKPSEYRKFYL